MKTKEAGPDEPQRYAVSEFMDGPMKGALVKKQGLEWQEILAYPAWTILHDRDKAQWHEELRGRKAVRYRYIGHGRYEYAGAK